MCRGLTRWLSLKLPGSHCGRLHHCLRQLLLGEEAEDQALDSLKAPVAIVQIPRKALFAAEVNCKQHQPLVPVVRLDGLQIEPDDIASQPGCWKVSGLGPAQVARCVGPASLATGHNPLRIQGDVCPCLSLEGFPRRCAPEPRMAWKDRRFSDGRASGGASSNQRSAQALSASGQALPSPLSTSFWRDTLLRYSAKAVQAFWTASPLQVLRWLQSLRGACHCVLEKSVLGLSALPALQLFGCRSAARLTEAMHPCIVKRSRGLDARACVSECVLDCVVECIRSVCVCVRLCLCVFQYVFECVFPGCSWVCLCLCEV